MPLHLTLNGETYAIEIISRRPVLVLEVDGRRYEVFDCPAADRGRLVTEVGETAFARTLVDENARETCFVRVEGRTHEIVLIDPRENSASNDAKHGEIHAPMPGAVVTVHKNEGDKISRGETIVTIESMKLQTALAAPRDGRLLRVLKGAGDTFDKDEILAQLAPAVEG